MNRGSAAVLLLALLPLALLVACANSSREPGSGPVPGVSNASADEDPGNEHGSEGDEDLLPPVVVSKATGSGSAALLAEGNRELSLAKSSVYSHKTHIDESAGVFEYDCSGLVDYALARVAPDAFDSLRAATVRRPLAKHFVTFFESIPAGTTNGRWKRVARAQDLVPGDIIAWLRPPDVTTKNTGHMLIVRGPVSVDPKAADEVAIPILDSTSVLHGSDDSRYALHTTGLGTGTIYLVVGPGGEPKGYRWSHGRKSHEHATNIALARVE